MGVYLSTANRDVESEEGSGLGIHYAAGGVQGWRKNMEDAHIAAPDLSTKVVGSGVSPGDQSLFAVFDGHGGKEVAKFCEAHFCKELVKLETYADENYEIALRDAFHQMDIMLEDKRHEAELRRYRRIPNPSDKAKSSVESAVGSAGEPKKKVSEQEAIKLFQRLMIQERRKRSGLPPAPDTDDDEDEGLGEKEEDNLDIDIDDIPDYVPNPGPPSIRNHDGAYTCNLADHRVNAGCTSVVVFRNGNTLYCANAGDSRAVLCRAGGVCFPLSEDHKPSQEVERRRIDEAGGFINQVGRVNGNLNLTRSLGDLKYKQVPNVPRAGQIITAEPDITKVELRPDDEFIIIACDGVWDVLTSEGSVEFVRERLQNGLDTKTIVNEVFDHCISDDPRKTQGIGGDNMTCIIIELNKRK